MPILQSVLKEGGLNTIIRASKRAILSILCFVLPACSIHQLDVQQGNVITKEMTEKLKIGMDKEQVKFILGTPLIIDPFHKNRWDYIFSLETYEGKSESKHITVIFKDNKTVRFAGFKPTPAPAQIVSKSSIKNKNSETN